jgi:uncharacterized protein (TIGR02145 family)
MKTILQIIFTIGLIVIFFSQCKKDDENNNPSNGNSTVTDIDGNTYNTVKIGEQVWMAENLRATRYNDGADITNDTSGYYTTGEKSAAGTFSTVFYYGSNTSKLCPKGWHIPSKEEWKDLVGFVAHDNNGEYGIHEAVALKAKTGWIENGNGTDIYGFSARATGAYNPDSAKVIGIGEAGYWIANENAATGPWLRRAYYNKTNFLESTGGFRFGYSVRCMKD